MARCITTLTNLGEQVCWLLVQQTIGMADSRMQSDFMKDQVAVLLFARQSLPERLCVTAAVRQMSGTTIYAGDQMNWHEEVTHFRQELMPIFSHYLDCMYVYGFPVRESVLENSEEKFPIINAGSPDSHPAHVLADIACMLRLRPDLSKVEAAWVGCPNGTLHSLIASTVWFPFKLRVAMPDGCNFEECIDQARSAGTDIVFCKTPQEAVKDADFIYAGYRGEMKREQLQKWSISPALFSLAKPGARLLLSASPLRAISIAPEVLTSGVSILNRQAEYRLRVHKRILHWVFA